MTFSQKAEDLAMGKVAEVERLQHDLAECYRLSGADPDGNEDWRLAKDAVAEVKRLREEYDDEVHSANTFENAIIGPGGWQDITIALEGKLAQLEHGIDEWVDKYELMRNRAERADARLAVLERAWDKATEEALELRNRLAEVEQERMGAADTVEQLLVRYVQSEDKHERTTLFLRIYAEKVRNKTAPLWEIPSVVANTLVRAADEFDWLRERVSTLSAALEREQVRSGFLREDASDLKGERDDCEG
jgi:chromosome segregation ATPase